MMELTGEHMGEEFREVLQEMLADTYAAQSEWAAIEEEHQKELDGIREHCHNVIIEIHEESKQLAELIRAQRLDRRAISSCAGRIGTITWREL
jgi:hypothetical protein